MSNRSAATAAILWWSGFTIAAGVLLILVQLAAEGYYIYIQSSVIKSFSSSPIGLIVIMIGAVLLVTALISTRAHPMNDGPAKPPTGPGSSSGAPPDNLV